MEFNTQPVIVLSSFSVCLSVFLNLSEQTHLSEVVVSLLQSGELSQEALVLSPLFIQLHPQSRTRLGHSLMDTLCTQTHTHTHSWRRIRKTVWGEKQRECVKQWSNSPSWAFSCSSERAESSSLSLLKSSFSLCSVSNSLKHEKENQWLKPELFNRK